MVYNGGDFTFLTAVTHKNRMDMAQILQGFSYQVCSTTSLVFSLLYYSLQFLEPAIIHKQPVAMLQGHAGFVYVVVDVKTNIVVLCSHRTG